MKILSLIGKILRFLFAAPIIAVSLLLMIRAITEGHWLVIPAFTPLIFLCLLILFPSLQKKIRQGLLPILNNTYSPETNTHVSIKEAYLTKHQADLISRLLIKTSLLACMCMFAFHFMTTNGMKYFIISLQQTIHYRQLFFIFLIFAFIDRFISPTSDKCILPHMIIYKGYEKKDIRKNITNGALILLSFMISATLPGALLFYTATWIATYIIIPFFN